MVSGSGAGEVRDPAALADSFIPVTVLCGASIKSVFPSDGLTVT